MYIRNVEGKLIKMDLSIYNSEKKIYEELWKKMFNITIKSSKFEQKKRLIDYIKK